MTNIVLLLVIIMLVFSVIGVTLFRDIVPMYFGNLSSCIFFVSTLCLFAVARKSNLWHLYIHKNIQYSQG